MPVVDVVGNRFACVEGGGEEFGVVTACEGGLDGSASDLFVLDASFALAAVVA